MSEKYIDLAPLIASLHDQPLGTMRVVLGLLDEFASEHPDQVPGRTITASEFDEAVESCVTEDATVPPHTFAARLGVVCVPDPEPTNAEKLAEAIGAACTGLEFISPANRLSIAEHLDEAGVKAPGGDDGQ